MIVPRRGRVCDSFWPDLALLVVAGRKTDGPSNKHVYISERITMCSSGLHAERIAGAERQ